MHDLDIVLIAGFVLAFGLVSRALERTLLTAPILAVAFGVLMGPNGLGAIHFRVEHDESIGAGERRERVEVTDRDVAVEVGPGQHDDDRKVARGRAHGVGRTASVQREHHVAALPFVLGRDLDVVSCDSQQFRVAVCRHAVAAQRRLGCRGDDEDPIHRAQVRKPANTSRRLAV